MPTEGEFEQARVRFNNAAEEATRIIVPVRAANGPDVLTGGRLTADIDAFIDTTGNELNSVAEELRTLAEECARRAEECRIAKANLLRYINDYAAFQQAEQDFQSRALALAVDPTLPDPGPPPVKPEPPPTPPSFVDISDDSGEFGYLLFG